MRIRPFLAAALVLVIAGCSSGGSSGMKSSPATDSPSGSATSASQGSADSAVKGTVDCTAIKAAGAQMVVWVQLLAQLDSPESIESIKTKQIGNLDLDKFLADMKTLHALDSHPGPLGNPKEAIDSYEKTAKAAEVLFATDPIDQAAIDAYTVNVKPIGTFLGHQTAIVAAMDGVNC